MTGLCPSKVRQLNVFLLTSYATSLSVVHFRGALNSGEVVRADTTALLPKRRRPIRARLVLFDRS